jgi:phosphoglycolate phosphatase-like HAD superfamily hydrolase
MKDQTFFAQIRELIARDELPAALEQLRTLLDNTPQLDEILHQSGRFQAIRQQIRLGLVSHAEATLTQNQIRAGLLDLISEMEHSVEVTSSHPDTATVSALRTELERAIFVVNSKNVVVHSTITAAGNIIIGDNNQIN